MKNATPIVCERILCNAKNNIVVQTWVLPLNRSNSSTFIWIVYTEKRIKTIKRWYEKIHSMSVDAIVGPPNDLTHGHEGVGVRERGGEGYREI